jgi:hypothetical protein
MRAKEFIVEQRDDGVIPGQTMAINTGGKVGSVIPFFADVSPGAHAYDGLDKYYDLYRFGMMMAGAPTDDHDGSTHSWIANAPFLLGYTPEEMSKIEYAAKKFGAKKRNVATTGSHEPSIVQKQSPVKAFKGYPR